MSSRSTYPILERLKEDPNAVIVAMTCEEALKRKQITPLDLKEWETSPSWVYNTFLDIPKSLRKYTYQLLINEEQKLVENHMQPLLKQGISQSRLIQAVQDYKELHTNMNNEMITLAYCENPYILGHVLNPTELEALDKIRPKYMKSNSTSRLRAHVASAWNASRQTGHMTLSPYSSVIHKSAETLAKSGEHSADYYRSFLVENFAEIVPQQVSIDWPYPMHMYHDKKRKTMSAIPKWIYHSQWQAIRALEEHALRDFNHLPEGWNEWIQCLNLNDSSQEAALAHMWRYPITFVNGGPGTGKTTLVRALREAVERFGGQILGCSPTGIAAKRMKLLANIDSETVHRRFGLAKSHRTVERGSLSFSETSNIFLVCDEGGMLDLVTFHAVMWGTPSKPGVRIIIIGDENQLPPVGYAQPFASILQEKKWEPYIVRLTTPHRTSNDLTKAIVSYYDLDSSLPWGEQLRAWDIPSGETIDFQASVLEWINQVPKGESWQVLVPFRSESSRHDFGANEINTWIYQGTDSLGIGRKIVQRENSRVTELRNGEIGHVLQVDDDTRTALFDDGTIATLPYIEAYREWMPADCLTVHKAQGGEYFHTLVILPPGSNSVDPRNLFTALSRSRETVTVMAQDVIREVDVIRSNKKRNPPSTLSQLLKSMRFSKEAEPVSVATVATATEWNLD